MYKTTFVLVLFAGLIVLGSCFSVPPTFDGAENVITCERLSQIYEHIQCERDGSFSIIQCRNDYCTCVNTTTGAVLTGSTAFKRGSRTSAYCQKIAACGVFKCNLICVYGYQTDDQGCRTCACKQRQTCDTYNPLDLVNRCVLACIRKDGLCYSCDDNCNITRPTVPVRCNDFEEAVKRGYGWGTCVPKLRGNDTCMRYGDQEDEEQNDDDNNDNNDDGDGEGDGGNDGDGGDGGDGGNFLELSEDTLAALSSEEEEEMMRQEDDRVRRSLVGLSARRVSRIIRRPLRQCRPGYYCRRKGITRGQCTPNNGPCKTRHGSSSEECDPSGYFKPRYCRNLGQRRIRCSCVRPTDGTEIADSQVTFTDAGDETVNEERKPKCTDKVYGVCNVTFDDRNFIVRQGRRIVDRCSCRVCRCLFGRIYCSKRGNCSSDSCPTEPKQCTLPNGRRVRHGTTSSVECNKCVCRYGRILCSDRDCNTTTTNNTQCRRCLSERIGKVCGPNGKTYINRCFAIYCAGIPSVDLLDGPCPSIDPCERFPCESHETCLRKGGVSCLALNNGCRPETLRTCVNVTDLECENTTSTSIVRNDTDTDGDGIGDGDVDPSDTTVCGTDGITYSSTCALLQSTSGDVQVLHAGQCNAIQCKGGPVCGTDGVTYDNICILRTRSDNARFDYRGPCHNDTNTTPEQYCDRVIASGRCRFNRTNCPNCLKRPVVGCCPICGGAVLAILDREAVSNASAIDNDLETLDGLIERVLSSEEVFLKPANSCAIEATLTAGGNIEFTLIPHTNTTNCRCSDAATNITQVFNGTVTATEVSVPPVYNLIVGGTEAQPVIGKSTGASPTPTPTAGSGMITVSIITLVSTLLVSAVFSFTQ